MPNQKRVAKRLRVALGSVQDDPNISPKAPLTWRQCIRCGWPISSPSACSGRPGQRHYLALGHNLVLGMTGNNVQAVLTASEADGQPVDIKPLADNCKQCWVNHGVSYTLEAKRTTGETLSKMRFVPQYGGPLFISVDCHTGRDAAYRLEPSFGMVKYGGIAEIIEQHVSRVQLTGCRILDEKLVPGGTRHDVLDHLQRTATHRAMDRLHPAQITHPS